MPKILEKRVKALMDSGMDESKAYAIATSRLQKEGKFKKGTQKIAKKSKSPRKKKETNLYYV